MNLNEQEMEQLLRAAPQPKPTGGLKKQLVTQIRLPAPAVTRRQIAESSSGGWLRRWWPALAPAALSLACGVVMAVQRAEMRDLKDSMAAADRTTTDASSAAAPAVRAATSASDKLGEEEEIARLQERAKELTGEIALLEQKRIENESLRKELATPAGLTAEERADLDELAKAQERARRIACINNMKQLGLAARVWEVDNKDATGNDVFPPDILSMTNEMNTPKILVCPSDTNRVVAANWSVYTAANCSYDYLAASASSANPTQVAFRCRLHGNFTLCDGSVQSLSPARQAEVLTEKDGKLYLGNNATISPPAATKP